MNCPESILAISAASSHVYKARTVATSNLQFKFSNRMDDPGPIIQTVVQIGE